MNVYINNLSFKGLVDTGVDVSIISQASWPSAWPLTSVSATFTRIEHLERFFKVCHPIHVLGLKDKRLCCSLLLLLYRLIFGVEIYCPSRGQP